MDGGINVTAQPGNRTAAHAVTHHDHQRRRLVLVNRAHKPQRIGLKLVVFLRFRLLTEMPVVSRLGNKPTELGGQVSRLRLRQVQRPLHIRRQQIVPPRIMNIAALLEHIVCEVEIVQKVETCVLRVSAHQQGINSASPRYGNEIIRSALRPRQGNRDFVALEHTSEVDQRMRPTAIRIIGRNTN